MAATLWHRSAFPRDMILPSSNPARQVSVGGVFQVEFKPAAGADLSVLCPLGRVVGYSSVGVMKARLAAYTAATSGNWQARLALAAVKAGEVMSSGPAFSATVVDWPVTAAAAQASALQQLDITVPVNAMDSLVDGDDLWARLTLLDSPSTIASPLRLWRFDLWQEL